MVAKRPYIVSPPLTEEDVISEIRNGNVKVSKLMRMSGFSRYTVRRLVANHAPKDKIKLPARQRLNLIPVAKLPATSAAKPRPISKPIIRRLIGAAVFFTAIVFAAGNGFMNFQFGASFGHDESSRMVLGWVVFAADLGALFLFATAGYLREEGHYFLAFLALLSWALCLGLSGGSALGFASGNIADSLQARGAVPEQRDSLTALKKRVVAYREAITETGDQKILENQMNLALGSVPNKNRISSEDCTKPTISAELCRDYNRFHDAYVAAVSRDALDEQIASLTAKISALAPISSKDPGADQISQMAFGAVTAEQVRSYLVRGLALIISISPGFILAFVRALLR